MIDSVELKKVISDYLNDYDPSSLNHLTRQITSQAEMVIYQLIREKVAQAAWLGETKH